MNEKTPEKRLDRTGKKARASEREERLRAQLRENMKRRKAQKRVRAGADKQKDEQNG